MKHYLKLILPLLFISCYSVERNCEDFHEGTFEFSQIINGKMTRSVFQRTAKLEIEVYEGVSDTASIRWVNDCECILTKLNPTSNQDKRPIQIKILNTKVKHWLDDFFNNNGKDSFSYNSSVLVNCSKITRTSSTNFF